MINIQSNNTSMIYIGAMVKLLAMKKGCGHPAGMPAFQT